MAHYFDPEPAAPSRPVTTRLQLPDMQLELTADRGVFAAGAVDAGTLELLRSDVARSFDPAGDVLDLGCGYGPIAVVMARRWPASRLWAVDVNERAVRLTSANAASAGLSNVVATTPSALPEELRFARILSNPPIRIGKDSLHDLLSSWLPRLEPGGRAWLVVHKHLGADSLSEWLTASGHPAKKLASRKGYRIIEVTPL